MTNDVDALKIDEFRRELTKLKLRCTRSKAVLRERLRAALQREEDVRSNKADEENSDTEDDEDTGSD